MDIDAILRRLNWFYTLETEQTKYYLLKAAQSEDPYIQRVLRTISEVEAGHVKNIADWIVRLGGQPTHLGEELGMFIGTVAAKVSHIVGMDNMFEISIVLEEKAICDYREMIKKIDNWELAQTLWSNLIEEDLHCSWFKMRREKFKANVSTGKGSTRENQENLSVH